MELPEWATRLLTVRWQKKRAEVLAADLWQCQGCGSTDQYLEVHHIDYGDCRKSDEYGLDMLQSLCHACHSLEKDRKVIEANLFNALRYRKWTVADLIALSTYLHRYPSFSDKIKKFINDHIKDDM